MSDCLDLVQSRSHEEGTFYIGPHHTIYIIFPARRSPLSQDALTHTKNFDRQLCMSGSDELWSLGRHVRYLDQKALLCTSLPFVKPRNTSPLERNKAMSPYLAHAKYIHRLGLQPVRRHLERHSTTEDPFRSATGLNLYFNTANLEKYLVL